MSSADRMERRHPASLVPRSQHDPALVELMRQHVSPEMIAYIALQATKVINLGDDANGALPTPPPASSIHEESGARNDALPGSSAQRPAAAHDAQAHASMCQSIECRGYIGRLPFGLSVNWRLDAAFAAFLIIALLLIVVVFGLVAFVRRIPISCGCANNRRRYVDYCDVGAHCAANLNGLSSTAMRFRRIVSSRRIALLLLAVVFRCFRTLLSLLSVFISYTRL